jgi:choloylglycine hydrolase
MKKILTYFWVFTLPYSYSCFACTTFFLQKNGQMVFGRNYDWITSTGMVNTNLRGLAKTALPIQKGKVLNWISKYGSVTFNQYGKEFPNGGINEQGLVVELMWLSESRYPSPDERPELTVLQWIQYQLDNCSTIEEVIATDKKLRIANTGTPQHYLIADRRGKVATIEFLNGKMVVHTGKDLPFPALANSTYEASLQALKGSSGKSKGSDFQANSGDRFSKACSLLQQYNTANTKKPIVEYSFDILNNVAQGSFTKWSIVYDITNKKIHFKTAEHKLVKSFDLAAFDFSCTSTARAYNMNQKGEGDISGRFISYADDANRKMMKQAFDESKTQVDISEQLQNAAADLPKKLVCKS